MVQERDFGFSPGLLSFILFIMQERFHPTLTETSKTLMNCLFSSTYWERALWLISGSTKELRTRFLIEQCRPSEFNIEPLEIVFKDWCNNTIAMRMTPGTPDPKDTGVSLHLNLHFTNPYEPEKACLFKYVIRDTQRCSVFRMASAIGFSKEEYKGVGYDIPHYEESPLRYNYVADIIVVSIQEVIKAMTPVLLYKVHEDAEQYEELVSAIMTTQIENLILSIYQFEHS